MPILNQVLSFSGYWFWNLVFPGLVWILLCKVGSSIIDLFMNSAAGGGLQNVWRLFLLSLVFGTVAYARSHHLFSF
jgi:hypothetical protein